MSHAPDILRRRPFISRETRALRYERVHADLTNDYIRANLAKEPDKAARHRAESERFRQAGE